MKFMRGMWLVAVLESIPESTIGSGLDRPTSVAVDGSGNVHIADTENSRVLKLRTENRGH